MEGNRIGGAVWDAPPEFATKRCIFITGVFFDSLSSTPSLPLPRGNDPPPAPAQYKSVLLPTPFYRTGYTTGGMVLTVTQEEILVLF